jgi:hypothetical protein
MMKNIEEIKQRLEKIELEIFNLNTKMHYMQSGLDHLNGSVILLRSFIDHNEEEK